jgi:hypothetical protein
MRHLLMMYTAKDWVSVGSFDSVTATAQLVREIDGYSIESGLRE